MENKKVLGNLAALTTNLIFGFSFLFSKIALDHAHPLILLSLRFSIAFLCLNILWFFKAIKISFKGKPKKRLLLMALAQPLCYYIFELYGIKNTSSALSGVIISLVPIAVIVISNIFLKEKASKREWMFALLSLCGVALISIISGTDTKSTLIGILLLIGAVISSAFFNILSRGESKHYRPEERSYIIFLVGCIGFTLISLLALRENYVHELSRAVTSTEMWGSMIYLAVISSVVAFLLYNYATSHISSVKVASYSNLITVVSVLAGTLILKESMSFVELICCIIIVIGVIGANRS